MRTSPVLAARVDEAFRDADEGSQPGWIYAVD
jgi:hypothetical protein